ncbi:MAG TPA: dihydrolipoyllysine-residue acetyltransferase [Candidatus Acidoferrales bacterium]|nr:dihydrolipoyllysine-residue acetyltransferase [Candidatus Acidoferrales bacterium]
MAQTQDVTVPDIGDFENVDVVDVLVKPGDVVTAEQPLITLESEKAALDVPAPEAGTVREVLVKVGDKVSQGTPIVRMEAASAATAEPAPNTGSESRDAADAPAKQAAGAQDAAPADRDSDAGSDKIDQASTLSPSADTPRQSAGSDKIVPPPGPSAAPATGHPAPDRSQAFLPHASPSVRKFARELGVDLTQVPGSGPKQRILREDVAAFVRQQLTDTAQRGAIPPIPAVDFSKFGPIERQPLSRVKRRSGPNLHRSWLNIPHVTQFDEADITELEAFRKENQARAEKRGVKLTLLAFLLDACAHALREFPTVNASLDPDGETLILKRYIHIGVAVDTPDGLMVPVVRDVDKKGVFELATEVAELAEQTRTRKLKPDRLQGASFSISSLGGIGGTAFTPIINAPEVAILGVSRARMQPVYQEADGSFAPRLMLPLSFSYDHRVIDGAEAARFTRFLSDMLSDIRRLLL